MPNARSIRQSYPKNEAWPDHLLQNGVLPAISHVTSEQTASSLPDFLTRYSEIGKHMYQLGQQTHDPDCFRSALWVYGEALAMLQKSPFSQSASTEICIGFAKSALVLADERAIADAISHMMTLISAAKLKQQLLASELEFTLGILLAKQHNYAAAMRVLDVWWATHVKHEHAAWVRQYALWLGAKSAANGNGAHHDITLWAYEFSLRKTWPEFTLTQLNQYYSTVKTHITAPFPTCHLAFGRALVQKNAYVEAIEALKQAVSEFAPSQRGVALFELAYAYLVYGQYVDATRIMKQYAELATLENRFAVVPVLALLDRLSQSRRHAVLVGINQYQHKDLPRLRGAKNDVAAMRDVLMQRWGFQADDITELIDDQATRDAILTKFKLLTAVSRERPCVFYFAGHGSTDQDRLPTIIPVDGRCGDVREISLDELAKFAGDTSANLVTIFDVGFESEQAKYASGRSVKQTQKLRPQPRFSSREAWANHAAGLTVGAMSLYAHPPEDYAQPRSLEVKIQGNDSLNMVTTYRGRLTSVLVDILDRAGMSLTLTQLRQALHAAYQNLLPSARTASAHSEQRPVFLSTIHNQAVGMVDEIRKTPLKQIASVLRTALKLPTEGCDDNVAAFERPNTMQWHVRLNLGIAYAACGDYAEALTWLKDIASLQMATQADTFQAHYHLGRVLFLEGQEGKLEQAASQLRRAIEMAATDVRAHYFLAQTIRAQINRQYAKQVETLMQTYLQHGAPFGVP